MGSEADASSGYKSKTKVLPGERKRVVQHIEGKGVLGCRVAAVGRLSRYLKDRQLLRVASK